MAYATKYQKTHDQADLSLGERNAALAVKYNPNSAKGFLATAIVNIADSLEMLSDRKRQQENYAKAAAILSDALRVNPKPGAPW